MNFLTKIFVFVAMQVCLVAPSSAKILDLNLDTGPYIDGGIAQVFGNATNFFPEIGIDPSTPQYFQFTFLDTGPGKLSIGFDGASALTNLTFTLWDTTQNNNGNGTYNSILSTTIPTGAGPVGIFDYMITNSNMESIYLGVEAGANNTFEFNATVSPVPEPETWGMFLIGLSLVAYQMKRKAKSTNKLA